MPAPLPLIQQEPTPEYWNTQAADYMPTTMWDKVSSEFEMGWKSNLTHNITEMIDLKQRGDIPGQEVLSVEELNRKYNGTGITWTEPKKAKVAEYIVQKQMEKSIVQNRIANGPTGAGAGALGFGANLAAHLLDPSEIALTMATGGLLRAAGVVTKGAGLIGAIRAGVTEGAISSIPFEAVSLAHDRQYQMDVSAADSFQNVLYGAAVGGILEGGIHGLGKAFSKRALSPHMEGEARLIESSAAQLADGRRPNIEPFATVFERERSGAGPKPEIDFSGRSEYSYRPIENAEKFSGRMYMGTSSLSDNLGNIDSKLFKNSTKDFGEGTYIVDDPYVANGYASSSFNDVKGVIHEVNLDNAKLLSLDNVIPKEARSVALDLLSSEKGSWVRPALRELEEDAGSMAKVYKALEEAPPQAKEALNAKLKEAGYDGLQFAQQSANGETAHNVAMLFDGAEKKMSQINALESDPRFLQGLNQEEADNLVKSYNDKTNRVLYDPLEIKEIADIDGRATESQARLGELPELEANYQAVKEDLRLMEQEGTLSEHDAEVIKLIDSEGKKSQALGESVIKALYSCLRSA